MLKRLDLLFACVFVLCVCVSAFGQGRRQAAASQASDVELKQEGTTVVITVDKKPFTTLFYGADAPKPYFHPLRTASGQIITRGYPMIKDDAAEKEGRYQDHPHHRGLWFTHGDVNGVDFWAEGNGKGKVVFKSLDGIKSGKQGVLTATFDWVAPDGTVFLTETKKVTIQGRPGVRTMDFEETLHAHGQPAKFGDTKEGTFAMRVTLPLAPSHGGTMVSSEGANGEKEIWGKRATWVDYYGTVGGQVVGVAIFDNPTNPKYPTYWHSRAYGLHSANPYGERDYYRDKSRDGSITIPADGRVTFRYRVFIHDGDTQAAKVAEEFAKYAGSPKSSGN